MHDQAADEDARAVARVLAGDREAFAAIVARHARRVHDLARRMLRDAGDAEDVVQQAFLNAYRALEGFDARRPFRHWLLRIASNLCRNRLESRAREPRARERAALARWRWVLTVPIGSSVMAAISSSARPCT